MPTAEPGAWCSVHVHRYERQDELLTDGVAPLLSALRAERAVSGFFFLRYWKGGHHLRLRLRVTAPDPAAVLDAVTAGLRDYCAANPAGAAFDVAAFRAAQATMAALEDEESDEVQPPDTVRTGHYEPEYGKYGGPAGVRLAEQFFARSSDAVLHGLPALGERASRRLGAGFSAMLRGLAAAGHGPDEMARFFADYCLLWSPYVFDAFLGTWPDLLRARTATLARHAAAVLAAAELGATELGAAELGATELGAAGEDPVSAAIRTALDGVRRAGPEVLAAVTLAGPGAPPWRRRQVLLTSYLHTHNNRLGLIPQQEALLGYLGHHVLSAHAGRPADAGLLARLTRHRAARLATA